MPWATISEPGGTDQPPGLDVLVKIQQVLQVPPRETSQVEELSVMSEPLEVVEEGATDQALCHLATSTIHEPLQGLKV